MAYGDYGRESGVRAMAELLKRAPELDAVFAANDMMAAGALEALKAACRRARTRQHRAEVRRGPFREGRSMAPQKAI
ncbi:hypothetical protein ASC63_04030 [Leifsonia sp. Root112D2]|nr:hypothetical protein ASC63_04030 [Leifsonia sp. Root112D2]